MKTKKKYLFLVLLAMLAVMTPAILSVTADVYAASTGSSLLTTPKISSVANTESGVKVTWKKTTGASGYYIYRSTSANGTYTKIATAKGSATLSYTNADVKGGTTYFYKVAAYNSTRTSTKSSAKSIRAVDAGKVSSLTNTQTGIKVSWKKSAGANGYYVYRSTNSGSYRLAASLSSGSTLFWIDTSAKSKSGTTYSYYVVPYYRSSTNTVIRGGHASAQSITRLVPASITALTNTAAGIEVEWSFVSGADGYLVYRGTTSGAYTLAAEVAAGSNAVWTDTATKGNSGTAYSYYVVSYYENEAGTKVKSAASASESTVRLGTSSIRSISNTVDGVQIKWAQVEGTGSYQIYRKEGTGSYMLTNTVSAATQIWTDTSVSSGVKYSYYVLATCEDNDGAVVYGSRGVAGGILFLSAGILTEVSNTEEGIFLQWNEISGASGYYVYRAEDGGMLQRVETIKDTSICSWTDSSVQTNEGSVYTYAVRAYYGATRGSYEEKDIARLSVPTGLTLTVQSCSGVTAAWDEQTFADSYLVQYSQTEDFSEGVETISASSNELSIYGLEYQSTIYVRVQSMAEISGVSSHSAWSETVSVVVNGEHSMNDAVTAVEPTCTESGTAVSVCELCGYSIYTSIDAFGHDYTASVSDGVRIYTCSRCGDTYTEALSEEEAAMVLDLVVIDGVATDLVSGKTFPDITVDGDYMYAGKVTLPSSYTQWTYEMIVDYNEESTKGVISQIIFTSNSGKYEECTNVFRLNEVTSISNRGSVCVPWVADSWNTGYSVTIPIQIYAHVSADYEYLPEGDTFWSFSMDSANGVLHSRIDGATSTTTMKTYTDSNGDTAYVDKKFPSSFTLTGEHAVKEIRFYSMALTEEQQEAHYKEANIVVPGSGINVVMDGLSILGSSLYFTRTTGEYPVPLISETEAGTYTVSAGESKTVTYTLSEYVQPDNGIDNSVYESVHITNEPETLTVGKQYPLTAYPYPFNIKGEDDTADEFDVIWSSSDEDVLYVIDGLLIARKAGTAQITATLMGTELADTVTITVVEEEETEDIAWYVPEDYVSNDGDSFSDTDYEMTTRAIYAAIDEAAENGYNHIIFPQINFYACPLEDENGYAVKYYVPTHMTIEFPEGSAFYMMDSEIARGDPTKIEIHYFEFGVPNNDYENSCEDSHLIIDTYYGESYTSSYTADDYIEENRFAEFGRKAINCSIQITNAYNPSGYFITVDGTSNTNKSTGVMTYGDFVSGWLNDDGTLVENSNWISTSGFITVPDYGSDGYFISADGQDSYAGKYWGGCSARQYDILWYDADYELIQIDRFQGRGDYYDIPDEAAYFKLSLQQPSLPTPGSGETEESPWIAMHDDGSAKMCELKYTNVYNSATGVFSVVGESDGFWVHHCYTNRDGMKDDDERTGDFENGWTATRHSVVSNCFFTGYFGNPGSYNTFIHTCYLTNYSGFSGETEMLRLINCTIDYIEISEKSQAHIYYNTIYGIGVDRFNTSIGHVYSKNNTTGKWVRSY